jgi:hypothetical protein
MGDNFFDPRTGKTASLVWYGQAYLTHALKAL